MKITFDTFLKDVSGHELEIVRDDGIHRHLKFAIPGSYYLSFQIITWPDYLAYCGDMGEFMFTRLPDMFEFFRASSPEHVGQINPSYWSEKCVAADKHGGVERWSSDLFEARVNEEAEEFIRAHVDEADIETFRQDLRDEVIVCNDNATDALDSAMRFEWKGRQVFSDIWYGHFEEYTPRFIWCCHAIRWGIMRYDAAKGARS